jgi:hypothetical protein
LEKRVSAIGGFYVLNRELRLSFGGKELLCLVGYGIADAGCCGSAGCAYALVPGYVLKSEYKSDERGSRVSLVEPIKNPSEQLAVRGLIEAEQFVSQVIFQ